MDGWRTCTYTVKVYMFWFEPLGRVRLRGNFTDKTVRRVIYCDVSGNNGFVILTLSRNGRKKEKMIKVTVSDSGFEQLSRGLQYILNRFTVLYYRVRPRRSPEVLFCVIIKTLYSFMCYSPYTFLGISSGRVVLYDSLWEVRLSFIVYLNT